MEVENVETRNVLGRELDVGTENEKKFRGNNFHSVSRHLFYLNVRFEHLFRSILSFKAGFSNLRIFFYQVRLEIMVPC